MVIPDLFSGYKDSAINKVKESEGIALKSWERVGFITINSLLYRITDWKCCFHLAQRCAKIWRFQVKFKKKICGHYPPTNFGKGYSASFQTLHANPLLWNIRLRLCERRLGGEKERVERREGRWREGREKRRMGAPQVLTRYWQLWK